jgi:hypothetical protein
VRRAWRRRSCWGQPAEHAGGGGLLGRAPRRRPQVNADTGGGGGGLLGRARRQRPQVNAVAETWPSRDLEELSDAFDSGQPELGERPRRPCRLTRMMTPSWPTSWRLRRCTPRWSSPSWSTPAYIKTQLAAMTAAAVAVAAAGQQQGKLAIRVCQTS